MLLGGAHEQVVRVPEVYPTPTASAELMVERKHNQVCQRAGLCQAHLRALACRLGDKTTLYAPNHRTLDGCHDERDEVLVVSVMTECALYRRPRHCAEERAN